MPLDVEGARNAIETVIAGPLGLSVEEAALGILRIAVAEMSLAVRGVSVNAATIRAISRWSVSAAQARCTRRRSRCELHVPTLIIPRVPGHFSALGMLMSDLRHDYVRTYYKSLADSDFADVDRNLRGHDRRKRAIC